MSIIAAERFWDFSVRTYRTSGVPNVCLSLQDEYGIDVNMLLYCCWLAVRRGEFDSEQWEKTIEYSTAWADKLVKPLRVARTWMKHEGCMIGIVPSDACMELREKVKSVEFDAEKMQQEVLELLTSTSECKSPDEDLLLPAVVSNVLRYCCYLGLEIDGGISKKFTVVVAAAFPQLGLPQILNAFVTAKTN